MTAGGTLHTSPPFPRTPARPGDRGDLGARGEPVPMNEPNPPILPLWPGTPPGPPLSVGPERDATAERDGLVAGQRVMRLADIATPSLHVYLPSPRKRTGAGVVVCPGGGFHILAWDLEGTEVAAWLNSIGVAAFVLKYRVPTAAQNPPHLAPAMDAQRTLRLVRHHARDWGIRPERVGILGFSAGGKTAGVAALQNGRALYDPADAIDRLSCRPDFAVLVYSAYFVDERGQILPEWTPSKDAPPAFFAHAADDPISCQSSVQLFAALQKAGVPAELHVWESGGHGYGLRPQPDRPVTDWPKRCAEWMRVRGLLTRG